MLCIAYMASLAKTNIYHVLAVENSGQKDTAARYWKEIQEQAAANKVLVSIEPCDELAVNRVQKRKTQTILLTQWLCGNRLYDEAIRTDTGNFNTKR